MEAEGDVAPVLAGCRGELRCNDVQFALGRGARGTGTQANQANVDVMGAERCDGPSHRSLVRKVRLTRQNANDDVPNAVDFDSRADGRSAGWKQSGGEIFVDDDGRLG